MKTHSHTAFASRLALVAGGLLAAGAAFALTNTVGDPVEEAPGIPVEVLDSMHTLPGELNKLPPVTSPADNPFTPEKVALGKKLFFDKRFSVDFSTSCATCHAPEKGFADGLSLAKGFGGKTLGRHTPTVLNTAYNEPQFWDGRAHGLEEQAQGPIMAAGEMNMGTEKLVVERIKESPEYVAAFKNIFNAEPSLKLVGAAIAAYERTVVAADSPFDRYMDGDKSALSDSQKRGLLLYIGKASCTQCHSGPNFTDNKFHSLGVAPSKGEADVGRFKVTQVEEDRYAFKTPSVRNAELTAPFMHDGSVATLEDLVEFYNKGGGEGGNKSKLLKPLNLTHQEKTDLIAFIKALTGKLESSNTAQAGAETHSNP